MQKFSHHIKHYIPLFAILIAGVVGFIYFPFDQSFQMALTIAMACGYVTWGVVHHYIHNDLSLYIIFEYICISLVGVVCIFSLLM